MDDGLNVQQVVALRCRCNDLTCCDCHDFLIGRAKEILVHAATHLASNFWATSQRIVWLDRVLPGTMDSPSLDFRLEMACVNAPGSAPLVCVRFEIAVDLSRPPAFSIGTRPHVVVIIEMMQQGKKQQVQEIGRADASASEMQRDKAELGACRQE